MFHSFIYYVSIISFLFLLFRIEREAKKKKKNKKFEISHVSLPRFLFIYLPATHANRNSDSKFRGKENRQLLGDGRLDEDRDHRLSLSKQRRKRACRWAARVFVESVGFENCSLVARHGARFLEASFFVSSLRSRTRRRLFWGEGEGESWSRGVGRPWSAREESGGRRDGLEKMAKHACGSELSWSGWNHNRDLRSLRSR